VPVGGATPIAVDVRIIAATHRNLAAMVRDGTFRQDLYFRLNVVRLSLKPLRLRQEETLSLASHFLEEIATSYEEPGKALAPAAVEALVRYDWPGNVRELRNAMERAFLFCSDRTIQATDLPPEIVEFGVDATAVDAAIAVSDDAGSIPRLVDAERALIARALRATGGNQSDAARMLDVERHRLRRKIVLYDLEHLTRGKPR
jgi:DNA-binding NtrC family response regulator